MSANPGTSFSMEDFKKLDETKLRLAHVQLRETLVLRECHLQGSEGGRDEVQQLREAMARLVIELERRKNPGRKQKDGPLSRR